MKIIQMKILKNCTFLYRNTICRRNKSSLGLWNENITTEIKMDIEKHWATEAQSKKPRVNGAPYYILPMFPYPSGNLHMGHVRVYSISDTIARFHKFEGKNVVHPIGWDAFGLPAENAAIERNALPQVWTNSNIGTMKKQLVELGYNFDWDKELSTCDPKYYKWTQYIFLKLYEKGLAYQNRAKVNWDPVDKTVLADEQVDDNGCSWRSGAKVEKKILTQWFIKTTKYAKQLYDGLNSGHLDNWKDIINLQKHWIGECNGVIVTFLLKLDDKVIDFDVWTSDPYKLLHGEYLLLDKNNLAVQELVNINTNKIKCYNPVSDSELPVFVTSSFIYPEGREEYLACPSLDPKDRIISKDFDYTDYECAEQSIDFETENKKAVNIALSKNCGGHFVSSKLKDWLISRQRYWGTPIPIIHCLKCGPVPVPYNELPVQLPECENMDNDIPSLLKINDWIACKCPKCSGSAKRETDTMDTFVDSSWYYYRFLDSENNNMPFLKEKLNGYTPIHCYIGGKEHAVLHLYYARFMSYFLYSLGWTPTAEPFKKLLVQGMVMGQSFKVKSSGKYIPKESVEQVGKQYTEKNTSEPVIVQWEKMSKSKHNGENPHRLLVTYGCDTTRLLMLSDVPPATSRHWSDATLPGVLNWQHRLWITLREFLAHKNNTNLKTQEKITEEEFKNHERKICESRNFATATTTYHFKYTQKLSVGISRLQSLTNTLRNNVPAEVIANSIEFELALAHLIIMISPVTPHFCSELWAGFLSASNNKCKTTHLIECDKNVLEQTWPKVDENYKLSFLCKVDGADRCIIGVEAAHLRNLSHDKALEIMLKEDSVVRRIKKGIFKTKYELYPDCRAILHIFTKRKETQPDTAVKISNSNV